MRHFIIPARGGSKTILDKNLQDLGGKPLIQWTIECSLYAKEPQDVVIVNTDDNKIKYVASNTGAKTYSRPEYLGTDHATMKDVIKDHFERFKNIDSAVILYPTCPFRTVESLKHAVYKYDHSDSKSLMSVSPVNKRPFGGVQIENGKLIYPEHAEAWYRKQDTPELYFANGSIFIIDRDELQNLNTQLFNKDTAPFVMRGLESIDIDTELDLEVCRAIVKGNEKVKSFIN